jgi:hypothetical protein
LEITAGPAAGRVIRVEPGKPLRVGRSIPSDCPLPADTFLSGQHFSIEYDGETIRLRDLKSTNGLFVNGTRVEAAILQIGDVITAGSSRFAVKEGRDTDPPLAPAPEAKPAVAPEATVDLRPAAAAPGLPPLQQEALKFLAMRQPLFALLDAAQDRRVLALLRESTHPYQCLYDGKGAEDLADFAPYLTELAPGSRLLPHLVHHGWANNWGVYLTSAQPFAEVRKHFRRFLMVETEDGKMHYFRFYDPRAFRSFVPRLTPQQTAEFFGPVQEYVSPGEDPRVALRYRFRDNRLSLNQELLLKEEVPQ